MSTHKYFDRICVAVIVFALVVTSLFMNGEVFGIEKIIDEDSETHSDQQYFTASDMSPEYDISDANVITLSGGSAAVSGNGAYAYDGGVVITSTGVYVISGTLDDGSITIDADDAAKVWLYFNDVNITCQDNAALIIENADKVFLTLAEGQDNVLASGSEYTTSATEAGIDGVIYARDDLTINGTGNLTISGGPAHGIVANDDMVITGGTITVTSATDAIHVNDSLRMTGASVTLDAGDDAIQVDNEGGYIYIESGEFNIAAADEGIAAEGDITIDGGDFNIAVGTNQGNHGIKSGGTVTVNDGTIDITSCYEGIQASYIDITGGDTTINSVDDGLNASSGDGGFGMGFGMGGPGMGGTGGQGMRNRGAYSASDADTTASGEVNEDEQPEFSQMPEGEMPEFGEMTEGETPEFGEMPEGEQPEFGEVPEGEQPEFDEVPEGEQSEFGQMPEGEQSQSGETSDEKTSEMKNGTGMGRPDMSGANGEMQNSDGNTDMQNESGTESSDDASAETSWIHISGGTLTIVNDSGRDADGIDSNGDIIITGGTIRVSLNGDGGNNAIDCATENGGVCEISGGNIIACGSSQMAESFGSTSTQCSVLCNLQTGTETGTTLTLRDSDGNVLLSYEVPYAFTSVNISCPEMKLGETYTISVGETEETVTLEATTTTLGEAGTSMFGGMNNGGMNQGGTQNGDTGRGGHGGPGGKRFSQGSVSQGSAAEGGTIMSQGSAAEDNASQEVVSQGIAT